MARFAGAMGHGHAHGGAGSEDALAGYLRAQRLWDATMAASVRDLLVAGRRPVVHVVGRFHVERDGGLALALARMVPGARTAAVVVCEGAPTPSDRGRGDVLVFVPGAPAYG